MTMVESVDKGIAINKPLAWTMLVALVTLVFWGGQTVSDLQATTRNTAAILHEVKTSLEAANAERRALETRVMALERDATRSESGLSGLREDIGEMKAAIGELTKAVQGGRP